MVSEPDFTTVVAEFLDEYEAFTSVQDAAGQALAEAHGKLKDAYMAALKRAPAGTGELAQPPTVIDDFDGEQVARLAEAETAAKHSPASPKTLAWDRASERELRDLNYTLRERERLFEQVWRMRRRGQLGKRFPHPGKPRKLSIDVVNRGTHVCAICERDHWAIGAEALVVDGTHDVVCWVCGDEHDAELTARALAKAVEDSEQWIAARFPDYFTDWSDDLRRRGMEQGALDLENAVSRYQEQVRRAKAAGLGHREVWLQPFAA